MHQETVKFGLPKKEPIVCSTNSTSVPSLLQQFKEVAVPTAQEHEIEGEKNPWLPRKAKGEHIFTYRLILIGGPARTHAIVDYIGLLEPEGSQRPK